MGKHSPILDPAKIDVVILCGGLGTRLRSVVGNHPKGMALVGGKPFLDVLVAWAAGFGFQRFLFCIGYKGEEIRAHFAGRKGMQALFSEEKELLGTAGALKLCRPLLESETFVALNGDSLCRVELPGMLEFHQKMGAQATIAAVDPKAQRDGGYIEVDARSRVVSFLEKKYEAGRCMNAGIYALNQAVLDAVPAGRPFSLERELFPALLDGSVYAYVTPEKVQDIGTPDRLRAFESGA